MINALADQRDTGRGAIARLSLARTAALLTGYGATADEGPIAAESSADLASQGEQTDWGRHVASAFR